MSGRGRLYKGDGERAAGPGGRGSLCPCAHVSPEVLGALAPLTPAWHPAGPPGRRTCCRCRPGCSRCSSTPRPSWGVTQTGQGRQGQGWGHGTAPWAPWHGPSAPVRCSAQHCVPSAVAQCSGSMSPVSPLQDRPQGTHMPPLPMLLQQDVLQCHLPRAVPARVPWCSTGVPQHHPSPAAVSQPDPCACSLWPGVLGSTEWPHTLP